MAQPATREREKAKAASPAPGKQAAAPERKESYRDLIEQIVVAFILAFLIRGFEAEAFVIPTGSMAPTLMGRHKDVTCPECGQAFQVNAADEVEATPWRNSRIVGGTCLNCRYPVRVDDLPSFKGDRILVMKFLYDLPILPGGGGPQRWDVVVFKYPEEPETNYIKRLVGLPGEELRLAAGDVLTRPLGSGPGEPFRYQRRPLHHQRAMQMLVWDDRHRPKHLAEDARWARWRAGSEGAWVEDAERPGRFTARGQGDGWSELRYRHMAPDPLQWEAIVGGREPAQPPRATLITDFYSYNSHVAGGRGEDYWFQPHWVGDLTLECRVQAGAARGTLRLELVEGGVKNRCEIDLASGQARLFRDERPLGEPAATPLKDAARHWVAFANVDDRLTLWVDGATPFGEGVAYSDGGEERPAPAAADLDPVGVAARGVAVTVDDLVLKRDIYYTLDPNRLDYAAPDGGYYNSAAERAAHLFGVLADPGRFAEVFRMETRDFPIRPGHYMMMGDNSPRSKDGRAWGTQDQLSTGRSDAWDPNRRESWEVPESLLVGKAFFVYWPHGKPFWPDIRVTPDFRVPFRPNVERMKFIR